MPTGLFLMKSFMDEVSFDFSDGTRVVMTKTRTRAEGGEDADS